jgi:gliding motility-associated-like protein
VGVSIAADNNNICSGTTVTFTATPTNGGSSPVYQWKVNGSNVGGNSATYSSSTFSNGDKVACVLTSNASCATGNPATSNIITITVQSPVFAGIDGVITICESDTNQINLFSIINNEQVGGTWYRIEGVGGQFLNINGTFKSAINATNSKFIYVVQAMNPCANDTSIAIININKRTIPTFTSIAPICQYDNVPALPTVSSNGITGTWSPNAISSNTPGTYAFTFSPSPGFCASQTSTSVTIRPNASSTISRQICNGQQVTVCGNTFASSGTFTTTCTSFLGCDSIVTLILNVLPKPNAILTASGSTAFCGKGEVPLATQDNFNSYVWIHENIPISFQNNYSYTAILQGNYSVIVANDVGCKDTSNIIHISFDEDFTLDLGDDVFICSGDKITLGRSIDGVSYAWSTGQNTPTISVNNLGVYSVTATRGQCKHSDRVGVFLLDRNPYWFLGNDVGLCPEITIQLPAPDDMPFLWDDNSTVNPRKISTPGTYSITLNNACGQFSDTINILPDTCTCELFAPNAFSPNGDQHNPFFNVINECPSIATLQIYDRWGIMVYNGISSDKGWDGYYDGIRQPQDTYIWIAQYFDPYLQKTLTKKGIVLLIQ